MANEPKKEEHPPGVASDLPSSPTARDAAIETSFSTVSGTTTLSTNKESTEKISSEDIQVQPTGSTVSELSAKSNRSNLLSIPQVETVDTLSTVGEAQGELDRAMANNPQSTKSAGTTLTQDTQGSEWIQVLPSASKETVNSAATPTITNTFSQITVDSTEENKSSNAKGAYQDSQNYFGVLASTASQISQASGIGASVKGGQQNQESINRAIHSLLEICAANNVEIDEHLRRAILGEELYDEAKLAVATGVIAGVAVGRGVEQPAPEEAIQAGSFTRERTEASSLKSSGLQQAMSNRASLLGSLIQQHAEDLKESLARESAISKEIRDYIEQSRGVESSFEVRIKDGSYKVKTPVMDASSNDSSSHSTGQQQYIPTVANSGTFYGCFQSLRRLIKTGSAKQKMEEKVIMDGVNLVLEEGKMYLILGAPGCGKSTLLKMIADLLPNDGKDKVVGGEVGVNGVSPNDKNIVWSNVVSYVDQIDRLHGYLTVKETLAFAFDCRRGRTHRGPFTKENDPDVDKLVKELDEQGWMVDLVMRVLGLKRVEDTFVGGAKVRGVSGGEKKRVTVGEMMAVGSYISCLDEISTGLDAATTFDICKLLGEVTRMTSTIKVVSLLQPPPETVALFDEIILLDNGRVLFAGPVESVISHFKSLGYEQPQRMDPADWLQTLPTKDGARFLSPDSGSNHLTNSQFVEKFNECDQGKQILQKLQTPTSHDKKTLLDHVLFAQRYANSAWGSIQIVFSREFLLWRRDMYQRKARLFQDLFMGLIVGTVFWQTEDPQTVMGVIFQCVFFISMGAMLKVAPQIDTRGIFYKEQDANFYPTWTFVLARALAGLPTSIQDALIYGSLIYWFAGFTVAAANYFVFLMLTLMCAFGCGVMFSIFSATIKDRPSAQAAMSISLVILVLFSGFTVQPDVIPPYYIWVYWINLYAWVIRAVAINEYRSPEYDTVIAEDGTTEGEAILQRFGFTLNGEAYDYVWVWYTLLFCIALCIVCVLVQVYCLNNIRFATGGSLGGEAKETDEDESSSNTKSVSGSQSTALPMRGATLTFKDVHYTVTSSITKEKLELLKGISGFFEAGKMTALMGSSGAGKTTLMDVLSLRKQSGEVIGEIRVNGHLQEPDSFRRCTGYVEQFDTQSPQLTVRETVEFSAKMRLDEAIPIEKKQKYVDEILAMLELGDISGFLVGSDATGGLSFEQKKRLSIAVELAANPSILFLDEPTSGLDARAASIVMRGLRRIADAGIAVVATIHQPSIAIFNSFDSLLLLKRGGETVFFGRIGNESCDLIAYLEGYDSTTKIKGGENPATWMLTTIGAGSAGGKDEFDYAKAYAFSTLATDCIAKMDGLNENYTENDKITFPTKYATSSRTQSHEVFKRLSKIYWRSPGYNQVRLLVSGIVALLFATVFATQRVPKNEADMNSRVTSIYISSLFLAVNAMNTVLPVYEMERNMFYRHKAALMYDQRAINLSFTLVEIPFIMLAAMVFCVLWYFPVGFSIGAGKFCLYWLFMTLSLATFTFFGQGFMAVFRDSTTAQGMGSLLVGMSSIFGGVLIRPQFILPFWIWAYWTFPLHYVLEGLLTSQFQNDLTPITPSYGSDYYEYVRLKYCPDVPGGDPLPDNCVGTAEDWIYVSFGGFFIPEHIPWNILYLLGALLVAKMIAFYGLKSKNYLAT